MKISLMNTTNPLPVMPNVMQHSVIFVAQSHRHNIMINTERTDLRIIPFNEPRTELNAVLAENHLIFSTLIRSEKIVC